MFLTAHGGEIRSCEWVGPRIVETRGCAAETPTEHFLVRLWEKMMGISDLGVDDDFFELGGDSIMMIQIQFTIFREYKIRLSTAVLTEKSSIRVFAGEIENHSAI